MHIHDVWVHNFKDHLWNFKQNFEPIFCIIWYPNMIASSYGNIFRVTGPLCGNFTGHRWIPLQRPVTRSFDVFFYLFLNKQLNKQSQGWWFETPSRQSWRHCNVHDVIVMTLDGSQGPFLSMAEQGYSLGKIFSMTVTILSHGQEKTPIMGKSRF